MAVVRLPDVPDDTLQCMYTLCELRIREQQQSVRARELCGRCWDVSAAVTAHSARGYLVDGTIRDARSWHAQSKKVVGTVHSEAGESRALHSRRTFPGLRDPPASATQVHLHVFFRIGQSVNRDLPCRPGDVHVQPASSTSVDAGTVQ